MFATTTTHYDTLGVSPAATPADIRTAYRALALRYHPDRHNGNPHFEEQFKLISEAYRALSDPQRRRLYDARLLALRERQAALRRQQHAHAAAGGATWPAGHRYHYNSTRRPAGRNERAYQTIEQRATFSRRERRFLLVLLILLTTGAGAIAMWTDSARTARAEEAYLNGMLDAKRGLWERALVHWSSAIREQPDYAPAYARRAEVSAERQHDYASALADYTVALHHLTATADRVRVLTGQAECLTELGRAPEAETALTRALALDPTYVRGRLARGKLRLYTTHQFGPAVADFTEVIRSTSASPAECTSALKARGLAYFRLSELAHAATDFVAALSADDTDGQTWYLLSRTAAAQGKPEQARSYAAEADRRGYCPPARLEF